MTRYWLDVRASAWRACCSAVGSGDRGGGGKWNPAGQRRGGATHAPPVESPPRPLVHKGGRP